MPDDEIQNVPLDAFDLFVNQAREAFDEAELIGLAENIKVSGQLQPGVAWFDEGRGRMVLICGERRFRALKRAGMPTMAVKVIRGHLTQGQMLEMNLAENIQRASLNGVEQGKGFRRLMQLEDLTASEVASRMGVSNATVSNAMSLLDLPETLQAKVASKELPVSVGAYLARVEDDAARRALADQYGNGTLNRDGVAAEVRRLLKPKPKRSPASPSRLAVKLGGLSVCVTAGRAGKLSMDSLLSVFGRICKEAKSLKDAGKTDLAALTEVLKAS
jgi:ParB family chromosome partitioning protein